MDYIPSPIDVTGVKIPEDILPLIEILSKNIHEVWAQTRISQGWMYGTHRDDVLKLHSDIVPYEELTESEKEHDRNSVIATLKVLIAMKYHIKLEE